MRKAVVLRTALCATAATMSGAAATISGRNFHRLCNAAMRCDRVVELRQRTAHCDAPVRVLGAARLRVCGGTVVGTGHSVFEVGCGPQGGLWLDRVDVQHRASPEREAKRSLGAALWARSKARVALLDSRLSSEAGFGLWLTQKARARVDNSRVEDCGRSSVVVFNDARLEMRASTILRSSVHGVCARGDARIDIVASTIEAAELRAVYGYHNASVTITASTLRATRCRETAAVQIEALRPCDAATLRLEDVVFADNQGRCLSVAGNVHLELAGAVDLQGQPVGDSAAAGEPHAAFQE